MFKIPIASILNLKKFKSEIPESPQMTKQKKTLSRRSNWWLLETANQKIIIS